MAKNIHLTDSNLKIKIFIISNWLKEYSEKFKEYYIYWFLAKKLRDFIIRFV